MDIRNEIDTQYMRGDLPVIEPGDTIKVHYRIKEVGKGKGGTDRVRIQVYEGVVLGVKKDGMAASVTVRKISFQVSVERVFPLHSPLVDKIEIVNRAKVRRAKLYYLRDLRGRAARLKPRGQY